MQTACRRVHEFLDGPGSRLRAISDSVPPHTEHVSVEARAAGKMAKESVRTGYMVCVGKEGFFRDMGRN